MITEDYVSFETAKLLKEKGFDERVKSYYTESGLEGYMLALKATKNTELGDGFISRPTLQMVMKWLREEHNKIIVPGISLDDRTSSTISHYIVGIWYVPKNNGGALCFISPTPENGYSTYEEACEEAIKYVLENLI